MNEDKKMLFPCCLAHAGGRTLAFYLEVVEPADNLKSLVCADTESGEVSAVLGPVDLGGLSSCTDGHSVYLVFTCMKGAEKAVSLLLWRDGDTVGPFDLTGYGKVDNPAVAVHQCQLHVTWEVHGQNTVIVQTVLPLSGPLGQELCIQAGRDAVAVTDGNANAYRPRLCSNGSDLLLAYELFSEGHYHIVGRSLHGDAFSPGHELGTTARNDQEPWLTADGDSFLLSFENSSPLYKDYVWVSPRGDKVIIPAFGHGWRVETELYVKRVAVAGGALSVSEVSSSGSGGDGRIVVDDNESSGCPVTVVVGDGTFAFIFCEMTAKHWHVHYVICQDGHWSETVDTGLVQKQRVSPTASYNSDTSELTILATDPDSLAAKTFTRRIAVPRAATPQPAPVAARVYTVGDAGEKRRTITYAEEELTLLWGDLHMHSNLSGCSLHPKFHCVELEEKLRHCRDVGRLDFALCTDHDCMSDHEWARTKAAAEFHNIPGSFTAFQGFEWTATHGTYPKQGHYNVLYRDSGKLYRVREEESNHITKLWADMTEGDVLTIPHHPADQGHPLDWRHFDPRFEPLVEIFQVRGSYEYPGNSMDPAKYRPQGMVPGLSILEALESGREFGFTSGGEHEGVGTTAVFAKENTREAIFDALRKRHVYGTTGDHIFLDFRVNGVLMGGEITDSARVPEIAVKVNGTAAIRELRIMRDGERVFSRSYPEKSVVLSWHDDSFEQHRASRETHYYYAVVEQANNEIAWASPVFLKTASAETRSQT